MRKKHRRENKALKLLIWIAAATAGVIVIALFAMLTSREPQQEHKKEREYRALAAPLTAQAAAKRIDTDYYVEGYATTFDKPYLLYEFEDGTKFYERIDAHALDGADMSDVIMQYDHAGRHTKTGQYGA